MTSERIAVDANPMEAEVAASLLCSRSAAKIMHNNKERRQKKQTYKIKTKMHIKFE